MPKEIIEYFKDLTGINLFVKPTVIKNKIDVFCQKENISKDNLLHLLQTNNTLKEKFINYFTTNETYFFREYHQIEEFAKKASKDNKFYSILSLPTSSGEEAYTIAIALLEEGKKDFKVLGVDISQEMIEKAKIGRYKKNRLRKTPQKIIQKYFIQDGDYYIIKDEVKRFVEFKQMNLFDEKIYQLGKFDAIFFRNLLIYFDEDTKKRAVEIINRLKKPDGVIYFGHADFF